MEELLNFLKQNNADPALIAKLEGLVKPITLDVVKDFLEKDDAGKKFMQSVTDEKVTKGIATFKEKSMPGLIEEEIKKKFPGETEDQKKLRILEENQQKLMADLQRKDLINKAITVATEKKLPINLVQFMIGENEDATLKNIELLEAEYGNAVKGAVENQFKESGRAPNNTGGPTPPDPSKMTDEQYFQSRLTEQKK